MAIKVGLLSLGCPKNLVDSEVMLGILKERGYEITDEIIKSDVAIVNTCSFIDDAKEESIDTILHLAELKREGRFKGLIVTGCLPQRYPEELYTELKEVDGFLGTGEFYRIADIVEEVVLLRGLSEQRLGECRIELVAKSLLFFLLQPKH